MINLFAMFSQAMILLQRENEFLFRSEKIYTVLTVVMIIFVGLIAFLIFTERKVAKLEKKVNEITRNVNNEDENPS